MTAAAEKALLGELTDDQKAEAPKSNIGQDIAMRWGAKTGSEPEKLEQLLSLRVPYYKFIPFFFKKKERMKIYEIIH